MPSLYYFLVCTLGGLWAAIELLSRYKDEPFKVLLSSVYCFLFIGLNVVVSGSCFAYLSQGAATETALPLQNIFISAFGAPIVLRSRLFDIRSGDRIIQVGLGFLIDEFLRIVDRQIDRKRAKLRLALVAKAMKLVDFVAVKGKVFLLVTNSLQRLSEEEKLTFKKDLDSIDTDLEIASDNKSLALGFLVLDMTGEKLFGTIIKALEPPESAQP